MSTADDTNQGGSKTPTTNTPTTKWVAVFEWAKQQGPATVLLLIGAAGIWRSAPYLVSEFKAQADRHAVTEKEQREAYTHNLEKAYEVGATRDKATREEILAELRRLADRHPAAN